MLQLKRIIWSGVFVMFFSCNGPWKKETKQDRIRDSLNVLLAQSTQLFADSIFDGDDKIIKGYLRKYHTLDSCGVMGYTRDRLSYDLPFIRYHEIGDLNGDGKTEKVMAFPPFDYCDDGYSYYFSDTTLPRLLTGSYFVDTKKVFLTEDIDEDGIKEVGICHSTGVRHYRYISLYRLKNDQWERIGYSVLLPPQPVNIAADTLVQKIAKNKFKMFNFGDEKTYWDTIKISPN